MPLARLRVFHMLLQRSFRCSFSSHLQDHFLLRRKWWRCRDFGRFVLKMAFSPHFSPHLLDLILSYLCPYFKGQRIINSLNLLNLSKISCLKLSIYSSAPFSLSTMRHPGLETLPKNLLRSSEMSAK